MYLISEIAILDIFLSQKNHGELIDLKKEALKATELEGPGSFVGGFSPVQQLVQRLKFKGRQSPTEISSFKAGRISENTPGPEV